MRLSRILRQPSAATEPGAVPRRRIVLWLVVAAALVIGLVLYFRYARLVAPLVL